MTLNRDVIIIIVIALCTFATRVLPFVLFGRSHQPPAIVQYLGNILPASVIAILVVYCSKSVNFSHFITSGPQFIAMALVAVLHLWKRNNLLSIGGGTIFYMIMIQMF